MLIWFFFATKSFWTDCCILDIIENFVFSSKMANSSTLWLKKVKPHLWRFGQNNLQFKKFQNILLKPYLKYRISHFQQMSWNFLNYGTFIWHTRLSNKQHCTLIVFWAFSPPASPYLRTLLTTKIPLYVNFGLLRNTQIFRKSKLYIYFWIFFRFCTFYWECRLFKSRAQGAK